MSNEKCFTTAPLGLMQIGFDYFTGKDLCRREFLPESSESLYRNQGIVLATAWDKVLIQHDDGKYKVLGNTSSHTTSINCKTIEDAVFLPSGLCFIEDGKIKIMNYETCDISQMDSAHRFIKMSMIESEEKVYAITDKGQLYAADDKIGSIPKWIPLVVRVTQISCGISHGIVLADNGTVYTWGNGSRGQLGHGSTDDQHKPRLLDLLCGVNITAIAAGGWHCMALADTGDVYVWGWNESSQLGFPTKSSKEKCNKDSEVGMLTSPKLLELENYTNSQSFVSICSISCGSRHSAAVTVDGDAISWGWGKYGQLGQKCCVSTESDTFIESERKNPKLNTNCPSLNTCNCNDDEHLPGLVHYFSQPHVHAVKVSCGRWTTYYSYTHEES